MTDTLRTIATTHGKAMRSRIGFLWIALAACSPTGRTTATADATEGGPPASGSEADQAAPLPASPRSCDPQPISPEALMDRYYRSISSTEANGGEEVAHANIRREVVRSTIVSHMDDVKRCLTEASPDAREGRLVVRFVIGPDGKVAVAAVGENETSDTQVPCCVVDSVLTWSFPPPEGGGITVVSYPFRLEDASGAPP